MKSNYLARRESEFLLLLDFGEDRLLPERRAARVWRVSFGESKISSFQRESLPPKKSYAISLALR